MRYVAPMRRTLIGALAFAGVALAAQAGPGEGPGWTGVTNPKDVIAARGELMEEIEHLMQPIDTFQVVDTDKLNELRFAANTVHVMLLAVPHLFPPPTNLYDPKAETPETLALPAIWKDWDTFYRLAAAASKAAETMADTPAGKQQLRAEGLALRASCDACHALFLRPYHESKVTDADINFDFDSVFRNLRNR
ncbi:MAG TPA: cytochrome c [Gammaproteobacteria bacterium]|nr:cytochrome c [Gammaproteobacteria bacterium]